jgi:GntR family transcriptional repressor for pyruvate dehydrogenase complex
MKEKIDLFRPVTLKRTFEDISDQIKGLIFSGALKPNDRLPSERDLAEQFNTGRMSVREALRILEESGFITIKQGADGGIFVKELDSTGMTKSISGLMNVGNLTLQEIKEARIAIESIILETGIKRFTKNQLAALESNINDCEKFYKDRKKDEYPKFSDEQLGKFHVLIAETSKNRLFKYFVTSLLDLYMNQIIRYIPDSTEYSRHLTQHREIYEAIKAKDIKRAKRAIEEHMESSTKYVERTMDESDK